METLQPLRKISPILKPIAARCNLRCRYCYYKHTHNAKDHGLLMSAAVLARIVEEVIAVASEKGSKAEFTWHGGEPLLAGIGFYHTVVELQRQITGTEQYSSVKVENNIQTNGTLISEKWCEFLREHDFSLGLSLDGPEWLHDLNRRYSSGQGSFRDVIRGVRLLQEYQIRFGVLAVVTEDALGHAEEILHFFVSNGIKGFDLSPCAELPGDRGESNLTIEPAQYGDFMIDVFDAWIARDDPEIRVRFLEDALHGFMGAEPGLCSMSRGFCGVFPNILPNGDVYFCDNYEGSEDMLIGNIMTTSLPELTAEGSRHSLLRSQIYSAKRKCKDECEWYTACGGGCPRYNRSQPYEPFGGVNYFCEAYKKLLPHIASRSGEIMDATISHARRTDAT